MSLLDLLLIIGATAWLTVAFVTKEGPFQILSKFRYKLTDLFGYDNNPFNCQFCAGFWIGLIVMGLYLIGNDYIHFIIQFFGILGFVNAVRGLSGEY